MWPSVFRFAGAPETRHQLVLAACLHLGAEAFASHRTAAWILGFDRFPQPPEVPEVSTTHGRHFSTERIKVHQRRGGLAEGFTFRSGVPVTLKTRTLLDVAPLVTDKVLESALMSAARGQPDFFLELSEFLGSFKGQGHAGISRLAALLRTNEGRPATGSDFETDVLQVVRKAGIHEPERQHPVFEWGDHPFAHLDFAWPWKKLALFADGGSYHLAPEQARKDAWQRLKLAQLEWTSIVVMPKMLADPAWISEFTRLFHPKLGDGRR